MPDATSHLRFIECDVPMYEAMLAGHVAFGERLGVPVPADWSEFGLEPYRLVYDKLRAHPNWAGWANYLLVDDQFPALVALGGFFGPPEGDSFVKHTGEEAKTGVVEFGYQTLAAYRGRGYATALARFFVQKAFADARVRSVQAHTLAQESPSVALLRRLGFSRKEEIDDADDGLIWRWQLNKS